MLDTKGLKQAIEEEKRKNGSEIPRKRRLELLEKFDWSLSSAEVGKLFGISARMIRKDKAKLKKDTFQEEALELDLLGELYRLYKISLYQISQCIDRIEDPKEKAIVIHKRWKIAKDFFGHDGLGLTLRELTEDIDMAKEARKN